MVEALLLISAYVLGSIPFGLVVSKMFKNIDIRRFGSGNIGATNVLRKMGARYAVLVLLLDTGKGALAVLAAQHLKVGTTVMLLAGFLVIVGHCFPVFLGFKGGKGVATSLGVLLAVPGFFLPTLAVLAFFVIIVGVTRYVSLGSIASALLVPLSFLILYLTDSSNFFMAHIIFGTGIAAIVVFKHRENIQRLVSGTESRIGDKQKSP
ncbi:MAG: glycerol-3-phosphate 1-O-acyltransferase PlsY [Firmicutes bacterium]|jgi:glycerol-3-phosphate acyltransferase PlsY|nr:glycerol-3-phosphate 1-O-acyltransferase PlsY [Bacillota bacterium]